MLVFAGQQEKRAAWVAEYLLDAMRDGQNRRLEVVAWHQPQFAALWAFAFEVGADVRTATYCAAHPFVERPILVPVLPVEHFGGQEPQIVQAALGGLDYELVGGG